MAKLAKNKGVQSRLTNPTIFFRFAVATSLLSVVVITIMAAFVVGVKMPETFDPANTRSDHWAAVGIVGYFGLLLFLPIAFVFWLIGWLPFKGLYNLGGGPVLSGALAVSLPWAVFSGWLVQEFQSAFFWGLTCAGALIGAGIAKVMHGCEGMNRDAQQSQNWEVR